jgi:hypothetical protein
VVCHNIASYMVRLLNRSILIETGVQRFIVQGSGLFSFNAINAIHWFKAHRKVCLASIFSTR